MQEDAGEGVILGPTRDHACDEVVAWPNLKKIDKGSVTAHLLLNILVARQETNEATCAAGD